MNKYVIRRIALLFIILIIVVLIFKNIFFKEKEIPQNQSDTDIQTLNEISIPIFSIPKEITDWRLTLVNSENILSEDFEVELKNIDEIRQFDARAIDKLNEMMKSMRKAGITNVWIQSSYRSVERQKNLYDESVNKYMKNGKSCEEAKALTEKLINKPGSSEHNLGLAVDFNKVEKNFKKTKGYKWLMENAEEYGFILRYPEEKEDITGISYEPWHWRYVGKEHAKRMNELNLCLEEYIEYLKWQPSKEV